MQDKICFGKTDLGKIKGWGTATAARSGTSSPAGPKLKTHKPKLKTKVRIHMKKKIFSLSIKCKHGIM